MATNSATEDGRSGRSTWRCSVDRGLDDDLLLGDTWSGGLRTVSLKEEGGARATRWPVAGESNDGFSSALGSAVAEVNGEASRAEAGVEGEERGSSLAGRSSSSCTIRWLRAAETVGGNGGRNGGEAVGGLGGGHGLNVVGTAAVLFGLCG
jgi:hypothetical protein